LCRLSLLLLSFLEDMEAAFPSPTWTSEDREALAAMISGHSVFTFGAPPCVYDPDSGGVFGKVGSLSVRFRRVATSSSLHFSPSLGS
jgi:hypothetical protein